MVLWKRIAVFVVRSPLLRVGCALMANASF
jgi:hypothetical protein